ncbi:hypothetical protein ABEB36_008403 [Hypothenemus hampei]|uniref:Carboxypeptidase n=1 Tax=Hypothenemus hampei TaxID=57062 RepID=A0ABD1ENY1_HYPHA
MGKLVILFALVAIQTAYARFPFYNIKPFTHQPVADLGEPLILTPYIENNQTAEAKILAEVPSDYFLDVESYSGYFTVDKGNGSNLFFWFFPSTNNYEKDPVILCLQGGPGISSVFGLFTETGPFVVENGELELREYAWNKHFSVLYIDQPVGTGFSFSTKGQFLSDQTQVGEHLYSALTQFFTVFPELQQNEFYISGESYAGKYIPAIAYRIHQNNPTASLKINLQGLSIGNGLTDPKHQFGYGHLLYELGLIDSNGLTDSYEIEDFIVSFIDEGNYLQASSLWEDLLAVIYYEKTGLENIYNFVVDVDERPNEWETFITQSYVRQAIHVGNQTFSVESEEVFDWLFPDITVSVAPWMSELLSHYRVLIYNGQLDILVGYVLTENYLRKLDFSASSEYSRAERKVWLLNNRVAGYVKTAGNLTEVMVRNAGHRVIADQPINAFNLIYNFVNGNPIAGN